MKNKSYIQEQLERVETMSTNLIQDVEGNRSYVNQQYIIERLEYIKRTTLAALERLQLEDDNNY